MMNDVEPKKDRRPPTPPPGGAVLLVLNDVCLKCEEMSTGVTYIHLDTLLMFKLERYLIYAKVITFTFT